MSSNGHEELLVSYHKLQQTVGWIALLMPIVVRVLAFAYDKIFTTNSISAYYYTELRDVFVGSAGKMVSALGHHAPRATDRIMERALFDAQQKESDGPEARGRHDALFEPSEDLAERGDYEGMVRETSVYTRASLHPWISAGIVLGVGVLATALLSGSRRE